MADRYAAKPIADPRVYERKLAITREYLSRTDTVIELGCGTGSTAIAHAPFVHHVEAFDVSPRMVEIARDRAVAANIANVSFECHDLSQLPVLPGTFEVVLMLNVLHLLSDWQEQVTAAYWRLKPGGVFVSSTVCMSDDLDFMRYPLAAGRLLGFLPSLSFFTSLELERAVLDAGFEICTAWHPAPRTGVFLVARKPS